MRKSLFSVLLLVTLLTVAASGTTTTTAPAVPDSPVVRAHKSAHKLGLLQVGEGLVAHCSGTAVAAHAILTATHCSTASSVIEIDGEDTDIYGTMGDGLDHTIIFVGKTFTSYVNLAPNARLQVADAVFVFGNPGDFTDLYRSGYVAGFMKPEPPDSALAALLAGRQHPGNDNVRITLYDLNGFFGDSGSALFNTDGEVVGVTSFIDGANSQGYGLKFMGSYELRMSPAQIKLAREFVPPVEAKEQPKEKQKSLFDWFKVSN